MSLPDSHLTPSLGVNPSEFLNKAYTNCDPKTRIGAIRREDFVILSCSDLRDLRYYYCMTDGQTCRLS